MTERGEKPVPPEHDPSHERPRSPRIGDIVAIDWTPHGVVLSHRGPGVINVADIQILADGSEALSPPGTTSVDQVSEISGHWDLDRICTAWFRNLSRAGAKITEQQLREFRERLEQRIADQDRTASE